MLTGIHQENIQKQNKKSDFQNITNNLWGYQMMTPFLFISVHRTQIVQPFVPNGRERILLFSPFIPA